jgi:hypothetical protein
MRLEEVLALERGTVETAIGQIGALLGVAVPLGYLPQLVFGQGFEIELLNQVWNTAGVRQGSLERVKAGFGMDYQHHQGSRRLAAAPLDSLRLKD